MCLQGEKNYMGDKNDNVAEPSSEYEKLTPQRKQLIDTVLKNLENGTGLWEKGWGTSGLPKSAITGKAYRGVNNFFLSIISMSQGYKDNRWATYNQIESSGWHFKTDEEGNSLAKGKGATIEFFELRDKKTKLSFNKNVYDGMTNDEQDKYFKENVYSLRKYYRVFNGDLIDGIPEKEKHIVDPNGRVARAENILDYWNDNESNIVYGGSEAFYRVSTDEVHLPSREDFYSMQEFYATALHEVGHSTGHEKRLNRDMQNLFGSSEYAKEELRAEIASMFIEQDLEISVSENHIQNNSAYIQSWHDEIKENSNVIFTAIADADKIAKFVMSKEKENIAVKNKEFNEVSFDVLQNISLTKATEQVCQEEKTLITIMPKIQQKKPETQEEKSEVYFPPSELAANSETSPILVDMTGRGIESLTRMSDREVVERASKTKGGEKFNQLYNGVPILESDAKNERSLMTRLAMFCGDDTEKLLRIFKSSGQFRDEKPNSYYMIMANQSAEFVNVIKGKSMGSQILGADKNSNFGFNAK